MTEEIIIERGCVHCSLCNEDEECYLNRCKRLEQENKKLCDELLVTQNQYNKVVEQNKSYNMRNMELEKVFKWIKTQQYYILPKGFLKKIDEVINISTSNDVQK